LEPRELGESVEDEGGADGDLAADLAHARERGRAGDRRAFDREVVEGLAGGGGRRGAAAAGEEQRDEAPHPGPCPRARDEVSHHWVIGASTSWPRVTAR